MDGWWGKEVFNDGWGMTKQGIALWNGQEFPEGWHGFVFEGTRLSGEKVVRSGTVTIVR